MAASPDKVNTCFDCKSHSNIKVESVEMLSYKANQQADENTKAGDEFFQKGDFFAALMKYSEAIGLASTVQLFQKRCECLVKLNDYANAGEDALKAVEIKPNLRRTFYKAMDCFLMVGNTKKVEVIIRKFREIHPLADSIDRNQVQKMKTLNDLGQEIVDLTDACNHEECLKRIIDALEIASADSTLLFMKLKLLVILDRKEDVEVVNLQLCNALNQHFDFNTALTNYYDGKIEFSHKLFDSISSKSKKKLKPFENLLGKIEKIATQIREAEEVALKDAEQAVEKLKSVLEIDQSNSKLTAQIHLKIANIFFDEGKSFSSAIRHATSCLKVDPSCADALLVKAKSYLAMKMFVNASAECDLILKLKLSKKLRVFVEDLMTHIAQSQMNEEGQDTKPETEEKPDTSYSTSSFQNDENVDISNIFEKSSRESSSQKRPSSTQYSFSSADNKHFKEYVEKPKPKQRRSYQELQNETKAFELNQKGCKEYSAKRYTSALKLYSDAIFLHSDIKYLSNRAACYLAMDNFSLAFADAVKCVEIDGSHWKSYLKAINCLLALGDVSQAEKFIIKLQNNVSGIDSVKYNEIPKLKSLKELDENIENLFKENHHEDCLKQLESALKIAKACVKYREMKIECLTMTGKFDEAMNIVADALAANERDSNCIFLKGLNLYHKGCLGDALDSFETTLKLDPDHNRAKSLRTMAKKLIVLTKSGSSKMAAGSYLEACQSYSEALSIDNSNKTIKLTLFYNRSSANFKFQRYKETIDDCTEVLKLNETHLKALKRRAHSHFKLDEFEDCLIDCEEAERLESSSEIKLLAVDAHQKIFNRKGKSNYDILGVSTTASKADVKKAYHKFSLLYHPDKNPGATAIDKKKLERKFKEITKAYNSVLSCCD